MRFTKSGVRVLGIGVVALALSAPLSGCGSDSPAPTASPSTEEAESTGTVDYDKLVPDAEVTTGLAAVRLHASKAQEVLPTQGVEAAKQHTAEMEEQWNAFEATVRKNEKALYLEMEDALADINAGVRDNKSDRVERGVTALGAAAQAYLEKHP